MRGSVFRNYYEGHMNKFEEGGGGWKQGGKVSLAGVGGSGWGEIQTTVNKQQ